MVEYIMIDEMLTNESSDTAAYMSALQLELSKISPQNKKKPRPSGKGRSVCSWFHPSSFRLIKSDEAQG